MYAQTLQYIILGVSLRFSTVRGQNKSCDKLTVLLYEDIGCEAVYSNDSCPIRYTCAEYSKKPNLCYRGVEKYKAGDEIKIPESCMDCSCEKGEKEGLIECWNTACPKKPKPKKGCQYKEKSFKCCDFKEFCSNDNSKVKCEYNGITYNEGDYFKPNDTCQECICSKGFKGKLEEPYCRRQVCLEDVYNRKKIENYCAPVYLNPELKDDFPLCCPDTYICEEDIIDFAYTSSGDPSKIDDKCRFLTDVYAKDTSIQIKNKKTKKFAQCSCTFPPFLTCFAQF